MHRNSIAISRTQTRFSRTFMRATCTSASQKSSNERFSSLVLDCFPALSSMTRMRLHANARAASRACVVVGGQLAVSVVMGGQLAVRASWWAVRGGICARSSCSVISGHNLWPSVAIIYLWLSVAISGGARTHRELLINEIEVFHQLHPLVGRKDCRQLPIREVDTLCERVCLEERLR